VAVETVIGGHYNDQIRDLLHRGEQDPELTDVFKQHRDEELEHLEIGLAEDAERAPLYKAISAVVQAGCRAAILAAKRV
jgi:ubiquinone biosynthesis monooxygenase Coq7